MTRYTWLKPVFSYYVRCRGSVKRTYLYLVYKLYQIRLFVLAGRYGGIDHVPLCRLPTRMQQLGEEQRLIYGGMEAMRAVGEIAEKLGLDPSRMQTTQLLRRATQKPCHPEIYRVFMLVALSDNPRKSVYKTMRQFGDIPEHKYHFYVQDNASERSEFVKWLDEGKIEGEVSWRQIMTNLSGHPRDLF